MYFIFKRKKETFNNNVTCVLYEAHLLKYLISDHYDHLTVISIYLFS